MTEQAKLRLLKTDLMMTQDNELYDVFLRTLLISSKEFLQRQGMTFDDEKSEDVQLQISYAAFLFRQRNGQEQSVPQWLQRLINNRIFSEKAKVSE